MRIQRRNKRKKQQPNNDLSFKIITYYSSQNCKKTNLLSHHLHLFKIISPKSVATNKNLMNINEVPCLPIKIVRLKQNNDSIMSVVHSLFLM